jgi:cyclopropane fatty-acyl-phospholipid synthase-like methyltransferase
MHHSFAGAERWAQVFDDPERDAWQKPEEVVAAMTISPGMAVADIGAGTGYFGPHLATAVGRDGHVLALDVEPDMVAHMQQRFATAGLPQVEARLVDPDDPGLPASSLDRILIVDTWHHIDDRPIYSARLRAALRPGGQVVIVDYTAESPMGPPREFRLSPEAIMKDLEGGGLRTRLVPETLPNQFIVLGERSSD